MTREAFIRKWLGNPEKPYTPENRDEMRDDLDRVINNNRPEMINFADKAIFWLLAAIAMIIIVAESD